VVFVGLPWRMHSYRAVCKPAQPRLRYYDGQPFLWVSVTGGNGEESPAPQRIEMSVCAPGLSARNFDLPEYARLEGKPPPTNRTWSVGSARASAVADDAAAAL